MHPVELTAKGIENIVKAGKDSDYKIVKAGCILFSRAIGLTVFPILQALTLVLKRVPQFLWAVVTGNGKAGKKLTKVMKFVIGLLMTPLSLRAPEAITGPFIKRRADAHTDAPFGVEEQHGIRLSNPIITPKNEKELKAAIRKAKKEGKQVSVRGSGMSQGTQTVPVDSNQVLIDMRHFKKIENLDCEGNTVEVGAGATWEELQLELNRNLKSVIVKQASDLFTIGGSIGINCHGWAHQRGAIASTVKSLRVLMADGKIHTLKPGDFRFNCMFGTLGYFGIIVSAKLEITDNKLLLQHTEVVKAEEFAEKYKQDVQSKAIPLFGGRLDLNPDAPLGKVYMQSFYAVESTHPLASKSFTPEPKHGTMMDRIGLRTFGSVTNWSARKLTKWFFKKEEQTMLTVSATTRNEALHPPINSFRSLHNSDLHTQWLQEYFVTKEHLPHFLKFLGGKMKDNSVRLVNATIRPTPQDDISVLPYADKDRFAIVICFAQEKSKTEIAKTRKWIEEVQEHLLENDGKFYQAYMPYATREQFEKCYGEETLAIMRDFKKKYDPHNLFGNSHTAKYYDTAPPSTFRTVFQTKPELRKKFVDFLCTIFYQLDEEKVLKEMDLILADSRLTQDQIYQKLLSRMGRMKKWYAPLLQIKALGVLKKWMGIQGAELLDPFDMSRIHSYMEIYDRRYADVLKKSTKAPLDGPIIGVTDSPKVGLSGRLQAGALFSKYPYTNHVPLNEEYCTEPLSQTYMTYEPIGEDKVPSASVDLVGFLGGLHHMPENKIDSFLQSVRDTLKPGAPLLLRDHNVTSDELKDLVELVHTFVNAADGVSLEIEKKEIRDFRSMEDWSEVMERNGFTRISPEKSLVIPKDPTENGMTVFVRTPRNLEELKEAARYRKGAVRSVDTQRGSFIEWGNVRMSKSYAAFIQTRHSFEFDYIGHIKQHCIHFREYLKGKSFTQILKTDQLAMNVFILATTAIQCSLSYLLAIPAKILHRIRPASLSSVERYEAAVELEYSEFIDEKAFYQFPYTSKIRGLWEAALSESPFRNFIPAIISTISLLAKAAISAPIRAFYTSDANKETETVQVIIHDPNNELDTNVLNAPNNKVEVIYKTEDGHKLISVPRYLKFKDFCITTSRLESLQIIDISAQERITLDFLMGFGTFPAIGAHSRREHGIIYSMPKLQDEPERSYVTYDVAIRDLKTFIRTKIAEGHHLELLHE